LFVFGRLRHLLQEEEQQYLSEIGEKQETILERQAKMRERAKYLKEKRESERRALVEEKLEQKWRDQCEEMRWLSTKRHQDEVFSQRKEQLRLKSEMKEREKQEEKMYAQLWENDYKDKCKREEMETTLTIERNREMLKVLTLQSAAIEKQKEELKKLKELEAQHLREEAALRSIEEQRLREEKIRSQEQTRAELNLSLRMKMKRRAREAQEELAMDMKLLERMLQMSSDEISENMQRKNELRKEMQMYRQHLAEQKAEEERREKEVNELVAMEVEKQWAKRIAQWRKEREARKRLLDDVIHTRQQQIKEKLENIAKKKEEMEKESEELKINYEKHLELEREREEKVKNENLKHQRDLTEQMKYQDMLKEKERQEMEEERLLAQEVEYDYQRRVHHAMMNPDMKKTHPRKLMWLKQQQKQ
jgi:hypothetical protein